MQEEAHDRRIQTGCLVILATVALGAALYWLRPVLIPFVLAVFFAVALGPAIDFLVLRLRLPRALAVTVTLLLGVVLLVALSALVSVSVDQLMDNSDVYQARLKELLDRAAEKLPLERFGVTAEEGFGPLLEHSDEALGRILSRLIGEILSLLSQGLVVLIFLLFLLLGRRPGVRATAGLWREIETGIKRYVIDKFYVSALTGACVGVILFLLGVDMALVFGLFAFFLNFIPQVGSFVAVLLPLPLVILTPGVTPTTIVLAVTLPTLVNFLIGNVLEPKIMAGSLDLHPVTILLALIFWAALWGFVGMVLAVPLTSVVRSLLAKIDVTAPVAELLAGRRATAADG